MKIKLKNRKTTIAQDFVFGFTVVMCGGYVVAVATGFIPF